MSAQKMKPGGIQDGFLGIDYQFKLLELFAHRSVESGNKFKLSTELLNVGKLDDVAFEVVDKSGNSKFIFGQAKHKKHPEDLTYEVIMDSNEFRLFSYFDSFSLILPQKKYKNIESILIITNNKIDDSRKDITGLFKIDSNNRQSSLYSIEDTSNSDIFKGIGKRFKFPDAAQFPTENQDLFKNLKTDFVAKKLVEFLLNKFNKNVKLCRQNRKFLYANICDKTKMEFRDEVLNGTDPRLDAFRSAFEQTFKYIANKKNPMDSKKWINDCWGFWKNQSLKDKLKLIGSSSDANADTDQDNFDKDLKLFIEKLVFVTDLKTKDIEERIKADLEVKYNLRDMSVLYGMIEKKIQTLITKRGKSIQPITEDEFRRVFEVFELFKDKIIVMEKTKSLFGKLCLEFMSTHQDILNFLDPSTQVNHPRNILHIRTQPRDTSFISMQIYSQLLSVACKDTFIIMKSSSDETDFKRGVEVFKLDDLCEFLIIELDYDIRLFDDHKDCLVKILENSSKRMIVISDVNSKINLTNCQDLELSNIYLKDLKIQDTVLNKSVKLQNYPTTWMDLIMNEDFLLNDLLLSDLLNTNSVAENVQVSKNYDKDLYISRTFECQNLLKPEILMEGGNHEFIYSRQEFESKSELDPAKNVHWLENSSEGLKWIKSSNNNSVIYQYIDEKVYSTSREDSFADHSARISILVDVAGMGKSTVLNYLAQQLKQKHPKKWIMKIDLNDYTKELNEVNKPEDLGAPEPAIEFLSEKIFKLNSDFEKILFTQSCKTAGNVILLFDGFDEVASYYKDAVSQLIDSLLETSIEKIFIATRPEWATYLEKKFKQINHSLKPFNKEDQKDYLLNFMKMKKIENADEKIMKQKIERILDVMSKSLNDQDYKITGIALITKLVAEFFEPRIRDYFKGTNPDLDNDLIDGKLKSESFNLSSLYQDFFDKSLMIYFKDKCNYDPTNTKTRDDLKNKKKQILKNYQKLAIQQILKTDHQKLLPSTEKLDENELTVLVDVGLVNNDRKFAHQTYGEFSFSKFLDEHFDDEVCSKFIVEVVLVDKSYGVIRSFISFWINEKNREKKSLEIYREKQLATTREEDEETPLHVAGREGKENIFWFLYSALTKTERFESEKTEIETYLMKMPKEAFQFLYTAFAYYFQNCDDNLNILDQVKEDFELDFIRRIFTIEMYDAKQKLLHTICFGNENIFSIFNFLLKNFLADKKFLAEIFLSTDVDGKSFLHFAFEFLTNETLLKLFDELNSMKLILGQDFINKLILLKAISGRKGGCGVFLSCYSWSKHFDNEFFLQFLEKLESLCGLENMKQFFLLVTDDSGSQSQTILHKFCYWAENFNLFQVTLWINEEFGKDFLIQLFKLKDKRDQTIFHEFSTGQSNPGPQLLSILKFLIHDLQFDKEFLFNQILFNEDKEGRNVFSNLFTKTKVNEFYLNLFDFIEQDLNLTHQELTSYLIKFKFLLFSIAQIEEKSNRDEILNLFSEKFEKTFFTDNFYSNEILDAIFEKYSYSNKIKNYLNFIEEQNDFHFLKNYISENKFSSQTILFHFDKDSSALIEILSWFKTKFGSKFLENFLLQVDENSDSFFIFILKRCKESMIAYYFDATFNFLIKNFDQNFVKDFLLLENNENKNFLNIICERCAENQLLPEILILNSLFENYKTDQDFFIKLINDKLKKNRKIKKWMKKNLNMDSTGSFLKFFNCSCARK